MEMTFGTPVTHRVQHQQLCGEQVHQDGPFGNAASPTATEGGTGRGARQGGLRAKRQCPFGEATPLQMKNHVQDTPSQHAIYARTQRMLLAGAHAPEVPRGTFPSNAMDADDDDMQDSGSALSAHHFHHHSSSPWQPPAQTEAHSRTLPERTSKHADSPKKQLTLAETLQHQSRSSESGVRHQLFQTRPSFPWQQSAFSSASALPQQTCGRCKEKFPGSDNDADSDMTKCNFCDTTMCDACLHLCDECQKTYCAGCSTVNYDLSYDRRFCLDCNNDVGDATHPRTLMEFSSPSTSSPAHTMPHSYLHSSVSALHAPFQHGRGAPQLQF
eukprot:m.1639188 g.1639188  ORF g.1639188 m.1639188 type:complete len:328 (+) comp33660_c0_seq1:205-1188(+)